MDLLKNNSNQQFAICHRWQKIKYTITIDDDKSVLFYNYYSYRRIKIGGRLCGHSYF